MHANSWRGLTNADSPGTGTPEVSMKYRLCRLKKRKRYLVHLKAHRIFRWEQRLN